MLTRIRFRILGIVLMAIVPAMALIILSAAERKRQVTVEIETNAARLSRFLASNLERDIGEGQAFLKATARLLESREHSESSCSANLAFLAGGSFFTNLGVADASGGILCSAFPMPPEARLDKLDWLPAFRAHPGYTVGFDLAGRLGKEASLNLAFPVAGKGGKRSILFAVMDMNWLNDLARDAQLPPGSAISVTNRKGNAVARYPDPDKWVGKPYPRARIEGGSDTGHGIMTREGIDGVRRLYAYSAVKGEGELMVYVGIRREAVLEPANRALRNQLLALGAVSLLAILAAWFGADLFLLKQVNALIAATRRLASGDLGARSTLSYDKGELGDLARAFDEMAETLEWRDAQLRESETERDKLTKRRPGDGEGDF